MKINRILVVSLCFFTVQATYAQLNPLGSSYFQNQYLLNPALAGADEGLAFSGAYKAQFSSVPGAPTMQSVTLEYGFPEKKSGFGMYLYNERAGVIRRSSVKATYAYHLELSSMQNYHLDFGISGGVMDESIDYNRVKGNVDDVSLYDFNEREAYFDGDFGIALFLNEFTLQGSVPNLKRLLKRDLLRNVADRSVFFGSLSYKIKTQGAMSSIEPKFVFRGVQNYKDIFDVGANLQFAGDKLHFSGIYHSTNSYTFGVGTDYKSQFSILAQYTSNTADLQSYSNGDFEISIRYKLLSKQARKFKID